MYIPKYFQINDQEMMVEIIENYSFATLFSQHNREPYATHLPLLLNKEENSLIGHFARSNPQWKEMDNQQVLVTFHGPHCYISPSWYETDEAVPTWNYMSIHVYGKMEMIQDEKTIYNSFNHLVNKYEHPNSSYNLNKVESSYIEGLSKGIVAFKINITKMEGKAKLSQNHSVERQELVIKELEKTNEQNNIQIASLMKKNLQK
ncbi:FMN-binding negative transcriptional regulator [Bacillus spongiae]|uniref:FMN-binding negative transcriptional regulator n=1 Tax=Bacillus spongiae TaxID=2683610 RepID=A0ABU8HKE1_9BACI